MKLLMCTLLLLALSSFGDQKTDLNAAAQIDKAIGLAISKLNLRPTQRLNDLEFFRKVSLDLIGRIPTLSEIENFQKMTQPDKRYEIIQKLQKTPGYVSHNYNLWADALRFFNKGLGSMDDDYGQYIKYTINKNKPYDKWVHELISAKGSIYTKEGQAVGYYMRDKGMPLDNLANTMKLFLGTDITCAQCHDHPFDRWSQMDFYQLAAFTDGINFKKDKESQNAYSQYKKKEKNAQKVIISRFITEVMGSDITNTGNGTIKLPHDYSYDDAKPNQLIMARFPYGPQANLPATISAPTQKSKKSKKDKDDSSNKGIGSREMFADWIIADHNGMFSKTIVNRMWYKLMGDFLIGDSLTDFSSKTEGSNKYLTATLVKVMKYVKYDLRHFEKIVMMTNAYQRQGRIRDLKTGEKNYFEAPMTRRLSAEQMWDSLQVLSETDLDKNLNYDDMSTARMQFYSDMKGKSFDVIFKSIPNNPPRPSAFFSFYIKNSSSPTASKSRKGPVNFHRASETSQPAANGSFLRVFGQSSRVFIDDSSREPSPPQALYMLNSEVDKIISSKKSDVYKVINSRDDSKEKIRQLFLTVLTKEPSISDYSEYASLAKKGSSGMQDLAWILLNSNEFKFY